VTGTVGSLNEGIGSVMVPLWVAVVLVVGLPCLWLNPFVKAVGFEVTACSIQDTSDVVRFFDWVVWIHRLEAFGNDILNARVESFEERCIIVFNGDEACFEERGSNSQEVPEVFEDLGLVANAMFGRKCPKCFEALLCMSGGGGGDVWVEILKAHSEVIPVSCLIAGQCRPEAAQGAWDTIMQDGLYLLFLCKSETISEILIVTQEYNKDLVLAAREVQCSRRSRRGHGCQAWMSDVRRRSGGRGRLRDGPA
jgi:hypothetical protein